jgi:hypothetical protein
VRSSRLHAAAAAAAAATRPAEEAKRRLREYGPNRLTPPRKTSFIERLWAQINNIVIWILFAAAIIEGALQSWAEFGLVLAVIFLNTAMGLVRSKGFPGAAASPSPAAAAGAGALAAAAQRPWPLRRAHPPRQRAARCGR